MSASAYISRSRRCGVRLCLVRRNGCPVQPVERGATIDREARLAVQILQLRESRPCAFDCLWEFMSRAASRAAGAQVQVSLSSRAQAAAALARLRDQDPNSFEVVRLTVSQWADAPPLG